MVTMMTIFKKNPRKKSVIHRIITENEKWINWDTLDKVTEEFRDDKTEDEMEEGVNKKDGDEKEITADN